jgi:hypothetical protein
MSGKPDTEVDHTTIVRHVKTADADRPDQDTDDLATHFITSPAANPVARLVIIGGPGAGSSRPIYAGTNSIGRETSNRVPLDFGDDTISRRQHALIVIDAETGTMQIRDGGKINPIVVNGAIVSGQASIAIGDTIELGTTTLLLQTL